MSDFTIISNSNQQYTIQKIFPIWISRHRFSLCFTKTIVHLHFLGCFCRRCRPDKLQKVLVNYGYGETKRESVAGNSNREFFFNCLRVIFARNTVTYLVSSTQTVHSTHLVRAKCFVKEVDSGHLAPENPFFVYIRCTTNITLVKRLEKNSFYIKYICKHHKNFFFEKKVPHFRGWKRKNVGLRFYLYFPRK